MFLLQAQLEPVVLKRLEQLRGLQNGPALGMCNCLRNALQTNNSAAGVEWSSTDGNDEIPPEHFQVDLVDASMSLQLGAWETWLAADGVVAKARYYAATHALVQEILGSILVGSSNEPSISRTALDAAWEEDAGSSSSDVPHLPTDRLKSSLAALATTSSSDGTPQTAAACLSILLARLQEQAQRWQGLVEQYAAGTERPMPATEAEIAGGGDRGAGASTADADADDINDDIDALLKEDASDLKDSTPDAGLGSALDKAVASADAPGTAGAGADKTAAEAMAAPEDEDDTFSLGLSRVPSQTSVDPSEQEEPSSTGVLVTPAAAAAAARRAARAISVKSVEDPELRRTLSETSSANLDDLPSEDLKALMERANPHARSSTRLARQPAASSGGAPGDINLGHLAEMDLRAWAAKKDKQTPLLGLSRGRPVPGSVLAPLLGRADAIKPVMDQHHKAARAPRTPGAAPTAAAAAPGGGASVGNGTSHIGMFGDSPVRQSMERERAGVALGNGISRHGSNDSPTAVQQPRSRSQGSNLSRKLSVSEPGPVGPQAEWKHLPALGQATRLHPHETRQSYGIPRAGAQSRGRAECAGAATPGAPLMEDKLPSLPALAGARGQPPKAMEFLRRPSQAQRSDAHHADASQPPAPNAHLPGLGPPTRLAAARALCVQATKKSFRSDEYF
ncbi:hypothetical protein VaNZ11_015152 [Volvox africanus]|uniref:Uncharacterized protein n=1 Tax=Volvox africanus TaxID=51714 RepID=A0ABQ5SLV8_9CHLO|nr:hypothetical protein VaNZ11_015152 [Volvox africanus]